MKFARFLFLGGMVLLFLFVGCSKKNPVSLGQSWEIYAVADEQDWQAVGPIIKEALEKKIATPLAEKEYVVEHVLPQDLPKYMLMKNLLLISSLEPGTEMEKILNRALPDDALDKIKSSKEYLFVSRNNWAHEQFVTVLAAPGLENLKASVASYPDYLYTLFDRNRNERLREVLFFRTHGQVEKRLKNTYGWTLKVPYGYEVVKEDAEKHMVQLSNHNPDRNIFVHWIENAGKVKLNEKFLRRKVNWLASFYHDAYVDREDYFVTRERLHDYETLAMIGLWKSDTELNGGPMMAYAFRDETHDRIYVVFANVFAPDRRKEPYLRELKMVLNTLMTFPEKVQVTS